MPLTPAELVIIMKKMNNIKRSLSRKVKKEMAEIIREVEEIDKKLNGLPATKTVIEDFDIKMKELNTQIAEFSKAADENQKTIDRLKEQTGL